MADEKMATMKDVMEIFKARQAEHTPKEYVEEKEKEFKHCRGKYAAEIISAKRISGDKDGNEYHFIAINVKIIGNGPKTKVNGKGRYLKAQPYGLLDKPDFNGEIVTASSEIDRFLDDLNFMGIKYEFSTLESLDALLDSISATRDIDDKPIDGTGRKVFIEVKPKYNPPKKVNGKDVFELKFDDNGYPQHKFTFIPDIPGYVEEGKESTTGGM